jgi:hypothetical protein
MRVGEWSPGLPEPDLAVLILYGFLSHLEKYTADQSIAQHYRRRRATTRRSRA